MISFRYKIFLKMKIFSLILLVILQQNCKADIKPDILLVVADDAGHSDVGYYNSEMRSPFLDNLANSRNTIRFDRFYAYPTCSPTRGALLSGRYAHENSLTFAILGPRSIAGTLDVMCLLSSNTHTHTQQESIRNFRSLWKSYNKI